MTEKPSLPIIDISPFLSIDPESEPRPASHLDSAQQKTAATLRKALLEHGFFYLTGHGVPHAVTDKILNLAREFFTSSSANASTPSTSTTTSRSAPNGPATANSTANGTSTTIANGSTPIHAPNPLVTTPLKQKATDQKLLLKRRDPGSSLGDGARGYQVLGENVTEGRRDAHEALDWYRPIEPGEGVVADELAANSEGDVELRATSSAAANSKNAPAPTHARSPPYELLHGVNLWPSSPAGFRDIYETYVEHMLALGSTVLLAMGYALGLRSPAFFVQRTRRSFWVMRAIGYPPLRSSTAAAANGALDGEEDGVSCGAHTDYGCLTLLLADETPGALQVLRRTHRSSLSSSKTSRPEWITVDPLPGAYVVNVGDCVELWTGGAVKSTLHRVVHRRAGYRVSVPFFMEPDAECVVRPMEEFKREPRVGVDGVDGVDREEDEGVVGNGRMVDRGGGEGDGAGMERKSVLEMYGDQGVRYWDHLVGKIGGNFYGGAEG